MNGWMRVFIEERKFRSLLNCAIPKRTTIRRDILNELFKECPAMNPIVSMYPLKIMGFTCEVVETGEPIRFLDQDEN